MMNTTNNISSQLFDVHAYQKKELNLYYAICEILVAVFAVVGNALVIFVFQKERRLRRRTNYYIVSLAAADLLVGLLGIPFAVMSSVGLPNNLHACLFTVSLLVVLCTISIFCLVAVSVDRYWAILHPMGYSRNVRTKTALVIISICWLTGSIIGFLPLMGWHKNEFKGDCFFLAVMDYNYLVFLYFGTIITPALLLAAFYAHIYQVVLKQLRQIVTMNPENGTTASGSSSGGTMLRVLGAAQKREVKATQNLAIIVLFFMICWIPLYTINCVIAFSRDVNIHPIFMLFCIILSHLNSAGNPLLYAYHLRDFRAALKNLLCQMFGYTEHVDHQPNPTRNCLTSNHYNSTSQRLQSVRPSRNTYRFNNGKHLGYNDSQFHYNNDTESNLPLAPKIATIVKNSAALVVAPTTAGEINKDIWKIPECSSESSESYKESSHEKTSIVRPATPYRIRIQSDTLNPAYLDNSSVDDESDDVFLEDNSFYGTTQENTSTKYDGGSYIDALRAKCLSTSSPQLSRSLFSGQDNMKDTPKFVRSCSLVEQKKQTDHSTSESKYNTLKRLALSPIKMFKREPGSNNCLGNDGAGSTESITEKSKAVITKNCGS